VCAAPHPKAIRQPLAELLLHHLVKIHLPASTTKIQHFSLFTHANSAGIPLAAWYALSPVPHPQLHDSTAPATSSASPTRTVATQRKQSSLTGWTQTTRMPWACLARNRAPLPAAVPVRRSGCRYSWPRTSQLPRHLPRHLHPGAPIWTAPPPTGMM